MKNVKRLTDGNWVQLLFHRINMLEKNWCVNVVLRRRVFLCATTKTTLEHFLAFAAIHTHSALHRPTTLTLDTFYSIILQLWTGKWARACATTALWIRIESNWKGCERKSSTTHCVRTWRGTKAAETISSLVQSFVRLLVLVCFCSWHYYEWRSHIAR